MASLHGKPRLPKHFSLISAQTSENHNETEHEALRDKLREHGYDPVEVQGNYGGVNEKSFMVEHSGSPDDKKAIESMGKEHKQESVLHSSRIQGPNGFGHHNELKMVQTGKSVMGRGAWAGEDITSHYTVLPDGSKIQMGVGNVGLKKSLEKELVNEPLMKPDHPRKLVHYSNHPAISVADPEEARRHAGSGGGLERRRQPIKARSYWYFEGTQPEAHIGNRPHKYTAEMPEGHKLYDIGADPKGIRAKHMKEGQKDPDAMEHEIASTGHHGYYDSKSSLPNAVAYFHPVKAMLESAKPGLGAGSDRHMEKSESGEAVQQARVREKLERLRSLVKSESIPARELEISNPESQCSACEQGAADCACYEGLSRPTISVASGKVDVMFKSDWTPEDKDNFVEDLKRRAGIVLKGKLGVLRQAKRLVDRKK
jgi:hypothetical protein